MKNIIGNRYQILRILFSGSDYCAAIGQNISEPEGGQTFLLNIYRDKGLIQKALPVFTKVSGDICNNFHEFFVDSHEVIAVFKYNDFKSLHAYLLQKDLTRKKRLSLCTSFLLEAVRNDNIPELLKLHVFTPDRVVVDSGDSVRLNFMIPFSSAAGPDTSSGTLRRQVSSAVHTILRFILDDGDRLPDALEAFLDNLTSGKLESVSTIFSEFKTASEAVLREPDDKNQSIALKAKKLAEKSAGKNLKKPAALAAIRAFAVVLAVLLLLSGGYAAYRYFLSGRISSPLNPQAKETLVIDNSTAVSLSQNVPASSGPQPSPAPASQPAPPQEKESVYTVTAGDNLYDLAQKYYGNGELYTLIIKRNNLTSNVIHSGMKLYIPEAPR